MTWSSRVRNGAAVAVVALTVGVLVAAASPASAAPGASPRGSTDGAAWTVTALDGSYTVRLTLPGFVPVRSARPQLAVDGRVVGTAQEEADGRTLTVHTTDDRVRAATRVQLAWNGTVAGEHTPAAGPATTAGGDVPAATGRVLGEDPADARTYGVTRADYDLGDTAVRLPGLDGRAVELRAAVYLPTGAPGRRPVVVFLHGRHDACYGESDDPPAWPCPAGTKPVPSYLGYGQAAEALARAGDVVVSVSADGINALDDVLLDGGAQVRGELVLAHLDQLAAWNARGGAGVAGLLRGRLDLTRIGLMGHSRGGEGVVAAALQNAARAKPYGIRAVMPLAPTDFGRPTLPGVALAVVLPYCDGDVNDQQGQHYYDDSRVAGTDDVLRTSLLVMGANHNFFNTEWTPGISAAPSVDDWWQNDAVCGAKASARLSAAEQRAVGAAYISGFFRLNLNGERQFLPLFDGTGGRAASAGRAVVYTEAQQPRSARTDLAPLQAPASNVTTTAGVAYCASFGAVVAGREPPCASSSQRNYTAVPHWVPVFLAPDVPSSPMVRMTWASAGSGAVLTVRPPAVVGVRQSLTFRAAPAVASAADLLVTVTDTRGRHASVPVSRVSPALRPLPAVPGQGDATDPKTWLRTVRVPLADFTGVDLRRIAGVTLSGRGARGDVYVSDVAFDTPASASGGPSALPVVNVDDGRAVVGSAATTAAERITLSKPSTLPVTVQVQIDVWDLGGRLHRQSLEVSFPAGSTAVDARIPVAAAATTGRSTTRYSTSLSVPTNAIVGDALGTLTLVSDPAASAASR